MHQVLFEFCALFDESDNPIQKRKQSKHRDWLICEKKLLIQIILDVIKFQVIGFEIKQTVKGLRVGLKYMPFKRLESQIQEFLDQNPELSYSIRMLFFDLSIIPANFSAFTSCKGRKIYLTLVYVSIHFFVVWWEKMYRFHGLYQ